MDYKADVKMYVDKDAQMTAGPVYGHDCLKCKYLGTWVGKLRRFDDRIYYDLYFCNDHPKTRPTTVIARHGNKSTTFTSGIDMAKSGRHRALSIAYELAIKKGLLEEQQPHP